MCGRGTEVGSVPPRRKRRSAEMRNSLRLFALLTALGAVNVYVFFFNHGTAPREILKPSSLSRAAEGLAGPLKDDAIATQNAVLAPAPPPSPATANAAPG